MIVGITVEKVSIFRWQMRKNLYFFRQEIRKLCAPANTTSKVFAKSFPTQKSTLLPTPLLHNYDCEKYVAFSSNYIVLIHESPGLVLCLILSIPALGLDDCLNPPLHTPYEIIQYVLLNQVPDLL